MTTIKSWMAAAIAVSALIISAAAPAQAQNWPTRPVRFIVPFGPGAGADIGARVFAEKLTQKWGQAVVVENKPGGDSIIAIQTVLSANDDHVLLFAPSGNFTVHPFLYTKLSYNPADLVPIARVSNTILAVGVKKDAPYNTLKEFTEAARKAPNTMNSGLVQGITEFTFWGYQHHEKLEITQVPYRDINQAPTDLGEGRIQIVMSSFSTLRPQYTAGRLKLLAVNNKTPVEILPGLPTARAAGFPSLEVEGLVGVFGTKAVSNAVKEKIAADVKAVSVADGLIADRLKATGQVMNVGGPKEFADSIAEQHNNVSAVVKAINFKPKN
jgi:tripartite-type tricarboxylate transporter receptor subunit TctC